jgi:acetyl-CoA carboxylase biotin carboxyl carrier protein
MTQRSLNHLGRRHDGQTPSELPATSPDASPVVCAEELDKLLDRVRHHAAAFVAELAHPPRALWVRAGEVSLEVEWAPDQDSASVSAEPTVLPVAGVDPDVHYLTSPMVGVFYRAPEPGAAPFVSEGDPVAAGQQLGIIEAMKLMIPIESDQAGRVLRVLKNDGEPVEYGERLVALAVLSAAGRAEQPCSAKC